MHNNAGTITKIDEILRNPKVDSKESYKKIIEISMQRLQQLTHFMMRDYPQLKRWEQTDDVFQTAVIKLYRSLNKVKPESSREFLGLANLQIRRTLIDLARHHFGPQADAANQDSNLGFSAVSQSPSSESDGPVSLAQWAEFHEAVDKLPSAEKEVFSLIWYSCATQKDVAQMINVSEKTVQRRYFKARLLLSELFDQSE